MAAMLLDGFNHVAVLTADTDRMVAFYTETFGAKVDNDVRPSEGMRITLLKIGASAELNIFEIDGNGEAARQTPMFGPRQPATAAGGSTSHSFR